MTEERYANICQTKSLSLSYSPTYTSYNRHSLSGR
jgi:hypothetical protein